MHIPPRLVHQIEAVVDSDVLEASTSDLDDLGPARRPLREKLRDASHHPARRQGNPRLRPHTHRDSEADAQGGGAAGDGLGDGPARRARRHRADLHHRTSQGAGRGIRAGAVSDPFTVHRAAGAGRHRRRRQPRSTVRARAGAHHLRGYGVRGRSDADQPEPTPMESSGPRRWRTTSDSAWSSPTRRAT